MIRKNTKNVIFPNIAFLARIKCYRKNVCMSLKKVTISLWNSHYQNVSEVFLTVNMPNLHFTESTMFFFIFTFLYDFWTELLFLFFYVNITIFT